MNTTNPAVPSLVDRVRAAQLPPPVTRREIRERAGATLADFAHELGVSVMTISRWERGDGRPRVEHAIAYRRLLDSLTEATAA